MCLYISCITIFRLLCNLSNYFKWFCNVMVTGTAIISLTIFLLKMTCPEFPPVVHSPHMYVEVRFCGMPSEGTPYPTLKLAQCSHVKTGNLCRTFGNYSWASCSASVKNTAITTEMQTAFQSWQPWRRPSVPLQAHSTSHSEKSPFCPVCSSTVTLSPSKLLQ